MKRRNFIVGAAGAGVLLAGAGAWLRPGDHGAPYDDYFARLNRELREQLGKLAALVDHYFAAWQDAHLMLERRERELAELRRATGPQVVSMRR